MMTLQERGIIARRVHANMADERAKIMRRLIREGGMLKKQAAYFVGVSIRTASRYQARGLD
jgi:transposase